MFKKPSIEDLIQSEYIYNLRHHSVTTAAIYLSLPIEAVIKFKRLGVLPFYYYNDETFIKKEDLDTFKKAQIYKKLLRNKHIRVRKKIDGLK